MKRKGLKLISYALALTAASAILSAGAVYGLSLLPADGGEPIYEGLPVTSEKKDGLLVDVLPPACGTEENQPPDDDRILIRAIDLSRVGADGQPETLVSDFAGLAPNLDIIEMLATPKLNCDGSPEVLIYHTHSTESYADGDTYEAGHVFLNESDEKNMVAVGDEFAAVLEAHGIGVIHDTFHHISAGYNQAYASSRDGVIGVLSKYSTVKLVIDIHRDSVSSDGSERKPLVHINGEPTAQVMLVVGSNHKSWQKNLSAALKMQKAMNEMSLTLARPIYFSKGEYNQSLFEGALLLEVGAAGNTLEEAKRAARLAAEAFCKAYS